MKNGQERTNQRGFFDMSWIADKIQFLPFVGLMMQNNDAHNHTTLVTRLIEAAIIGGVVLYGTVQTIGEQLNGIEHRVEQVENKVDGISGLYNQVENNSDKLGSIENDIYKPVYPHPALKDKAEKRVLRNEITNDDDGSGK